MAQTFSGGREILGDPVPKPLRFFGAWTLPQRCFPGKLGGCFSGHTRRSAAGGAARVTSRPMRTIGSLWLRARRDRRRRSAEGLPSRYRRRDSSGRRNHRPGRPRPVLAQTGRFDRRQSAAGRPHGRGAARRPGRGPRRRPTRQSAAGVGPAPRTTINAVVLARFTWA
jgi:hypothetical protein